MWKCARTLAVVLVCCLHRVALLPVERQNVSSPTSQWDTLYDKEIGTWCQPADVNGAHELVQQPPASNGEQKMSTDVKESATLTRWVDAALRVVRTHLVATNCTEGTSSWCAQHPESAGHRPVPGSMNLYAAMADKRPNHRMEAVLPDGSLSKTGPHDAWILLDPTPHLAMGHTVYLFTVDLNTSDVSCISAGGIPLEGGTGGECLNQVFKNRCPNRMVRRATRHRNAVQHRCDVDFLPLVHYQNRAPSQNEQRLLCNNQVKGFAPCPALRSWNETSELICDPLSSNHKRCDTTQDVVKTRCRLFETCDQAVLLSGGWNWQSSGEREVARLMAVYRMLRHNGFDKQGIKVFFANGARAKKIHHGSHHHQQQQQQSEQQEPDQPDSLEQQLQHLQDIPSPSSNPDADPFSFLSSSGGPTEAQPAANPHRHDHRPADERPAMYPAALKIGLRNHIRNVCTTPHCADSFVIYLSSPTRTSDGASLLWDADNNGEYDETEVYTVREFLRDIQDCVARQVVVLVDQNYSGLLADGLKRSRRHANVLMFTSGTSQQLASIGELTYHWTNYAHGPHCLSQAFQDSVKAIRFSNTRFEDSSNGSLALNLFGAPCDAVPPYSTYELKSLYMGCQYVPTRLWLSRPGSDTDPPPRLLTGR